MTYVVTAIRLRNIIGYIMPPMDAPKAAMAKAIGFFLSTSRD